MRTMTDNKNLRGLFLWLAIFATLLASLAPTVSRIVFSHTASSPGWIEVCTAEGLQQLPTVLFTDAQSPASENSGSHFGNYFDCCPFCATHACSFGLIPVEAISLSLIAAQDHDFPPHALSAPQARFVWQPSQARAPPVFL